MADSWHSLTHPGIQSLHPYVPGKAIEELAKEQGLTDIIKLASNENPLGCSPKAKQAIANLSCQQLALYPSPINHPLYADLATHLQIDPQNLFLSSGTDYIFWFLLTIFALRQNKYVLTHEYAFITYSIQAQILDIPMLITQDINFKVDLDALIKTTLEKNIALIFIANPNNPTGLLIKYEEIVYLLKKIPKTTILILDEAYYEYAYSPGDRRTLNLLQQFNNLVITRTFSKWYGLAGLRLGYAIADPDIIALLWRIQLPFSINQAALFAARAALFDQEFGKQTQICNQSGMTQLNKGLKDLGLEVLPSSANFITFDCGRNGKEVYTKLLTRGIIVRPLDPYNLPHHLRVTIGTKEQNSRFLQTLAQIME